MIAKMTAKMAAKITTIAQNIKNRKDIFFQRGRGNENI